MDLEAKKKVLRSFTYGLYVLTARDGEEYAAGTAGYYRWRIHAYSGSGSYTFWMKRP